MQKDNILIISITSFIILFVLMVIFIPQAESQVQVLQPKYPIVSDVISNNWRVRWIEVKNDIDRKIYNINITNLQDTSRGFNLTLLFNNATFPLQQAGNNLDVKFYELKNITGFELIPITQNILRPCEFNASLTCGEVKIIGYNNVSFNRIQYKSSKSQFLKRNANNYRENMGTINIPRSTAKDKNDGVINATKQFILEIKNIPIQETNSGWGSKIRLAIIDESTGNEYHPWANVTFLKVKNITIRNRGKANITNYTMLIKVPYDSDMMANFADLRFYFYNGTSDTQTKLSYWIQNFTASNSAEVWVGRIPRINNATDSSSNNITIKMYYDNSTLILNESLGNTTFIHFETSPDIFDNVVHWTNTSANCVGDTNCVYSKNPSFEPKGALWLQTGPAGSTALIKKSEYLFNFKTSQEGWAIKARVKMSDTNLATGTASTIHQTMLCFQNTTVGGDAGGGDGGPSQICATYIRDAAATKTTTVKVRCEDRTTTCSGVEFLGGRPISRDITATNTLNRYTYMELLYSNRSNNFTARIDGESSPNYANASSNGTMTEFTNARIKFGDGRVGTLAGLKGNSSWDWVFARKHIQPEPQYSILTEESLTNSKLLYYNNRSNATLIRNGSRIIFNINWTINNSITPILNVKFETNITGTAKNYSNGTTFHSAKYNITNTSVRKGRFYWKSYAATASTERNDTERMFVLVDNVKPVIRVVNIPTNTLNPTVEITIKDNLGNGTCWYNVTTQAAPNNCAAGFICPTFFSCTTDPSISNLVDGQSYRFWLTANDTSGNLNITRGNSINIFNWTVNVATTTVAGGGGGGGGGGTTLFALGIQCTEDVQCASGICDTVSKVCTIGLCGNGLCDRDKGENFAMCSQDCGLTQAFTEGLPGGVAGGAIVVGIGLTAILLFKPRKQKVKQK